MTITSSINQTPKYLMTDYEEHNERQNKEDEKYQKLTITEKAIFDDIERKEKKLKALKFVIVEKKEY